jgi:hypothetical protein
MWVELSNIFIFLVYFSLLFDPFRCTIV